MPNLYKHYIIRKFSKFLSKERILLLLDLERKLGVRISDFNLLNIALTHKSYPISQKAMKSKHNERLEFLGDSVISFIISEYLYQLFQDSDEGFLSKIKSDIVSRKTMYDIGKSIELEKYILSHPHIELFQNGEKSIISNAFESLIGAYYLSEGIEKTRKLVIKTFSDTIEKRIREGTSDYKTMLQNYSMKYFKVLPVYKISEESGPHHNKNYLVQVNVLDIFKVTGEGKSKKEAEQNAARNLLKVIRKDNS